MATILIDYENVNGFSLLPGLDLLTSDDRLVIFYSKSCNTIRREYWDIINASGCEFSTVKLLHKGEQYLDKYICIAVGELRSAGENEVAIISADKGYQAVLDYYITTDVTDFKIVRANTIEQALLSFCNPIHKKRRGIIIERSKKIDLDEISVMVKERTSIKAKIKAALMNTPYWYLIKDVCEFVTDREAGDNRSLYTGAMHNFGRENGRALYNIIKKVI